MAGGWQVRRINGLWCCQYADNPALDSSDPVNVGKHLSMSTRDWSLEEDELAVAQSGQDFIEY